MQFQGREAESEVFYGATPEEADARVARFCQGRNILNTEMHMIRAGPGVKYCVRVIYENPTGPQILMEG